MSNQRFFVFTLYKQKPKDMIQAYKTLIQNSKLDIEVYPDDINQWNAKELFAGHLLLSFNYKCEGWFHKESNGTNDFVFQGKYILIDEVYKENGESEGFTPEQINELEMLIFNKISFS